LYSRIPILLLVLTSLAASETMTVFFIDPGYAAYSGDAILVMTPSGRNYLIDGGDRGQNPPWDCGCSRVLPLLDSLGIDHLDGIVATHPHTDHMGGLIYVLDRIGADVVWDSGLPSSSYVYADFLEAVEACGAVLETPRMGDTLDWGPGLEVVVLHPQDPLDPGNVNNASIVLRIAFSEISFLFAGDLETDGGEDLVLAAVSSGRLGSIASNVLKVGHHGSFTSTSTPWLAAISPDWAAIEVGAGNPFGHPHGEVLARLMGRDISIFRTDLDGTFYIATDGENLFYNTLPGGGAEPEQPRGLIAYPSPCSDHVTFSWTADGGSSVIRVVNLAGETVRAWETTESSIHWDLSLEEGSLASPGLYAAVRESGGGGNCVEYFAVVR